MEEQEQEQELKRVDSGAPLLQVTDDDYVTEEINGILLRFTKCAHLEEIIFDRNERQSDFISIDSVKPTLTIPIWLDHLCLECNCFQAFIEELTNAAATFLPSKKASTKTNALNQIKLKLWYRETQASNYGCALCVCSSKKEYNSTVITITIKSQEEMEKITTHLKKIFAPMAKAFQKDRKSEKIVCKRCQALATATASGIGTGGIFGMATFLVTKIAGVATKTALICGSSTLAGGFVLGITAAGAIIVICEITSMADDDRENIRNNKELTCRDAPSWNLDYLFRSILYKYGSDCFDCDDESMRSNEYGKSRARHILNDFALAQLLLPLKRKVIEVKMRYETLRV